MAFVAAAGITTLATAGPGPRPLPEPAPVAAAPATLWDGVVRVLTAPATTPGLWLGCPEGFRLAYLMGKLVCSTKDELSLKTAPVQTVPMTELLRAAKGERAQLVGVLPAEDYRLDSPPGTATEVLILYRNPAPAR